MDRVAGVAEKEAGNQAFRDGDIERAIHLYTEAIDKNTTEHTYYSNRSAAYLKSGNFRKAVDDALTCTQLKPDWAKGYYRLGEGYYGRELFAKASDAFSKALDLDPTDVGVREGLSRSEKALYNRMLEEDDEIIEGEMSRVLGSRQPSRLEHSFDSQSSFLSTDMERKEREREVMNRRFMSSTGVTSLEDYKRFKAAGGTALKADAPSHINAELPEGFKAPAKSREEFLKSMGIESEVQVGSSGLGAPGVSHERRESSDFGGYGNRSNEERKKEELQKKREEFMTSLGGSETASTTSSTLNSDWGKIAGVGAPALSGDWAKIASGSVSSASSTLPAQSLQSSPSDEDMAWRPQSVSTTGSTPTGTTMSKQEFMASLGMNEDALKMPAPGASNSSTPLSRRVSSGHSTPPLHGRRSGVPSPASMNYPTLPQPAIPISESSFPAAPKTKTSGPTVSGEEDHQQEGHMDTSVFAKEALASASVSARHPLFAGLKTKLPAAGTGSEGGCSEPAADSFRKPFDPLAPSGLAPELAAVKGQGHAVADSWLEEFRQQKKRGEIKAPPVGDERIVELKKNYEDFHYRQYKETSADDHVTQRSIIGNAITAEALSDYDFTKMSR